MRKFEVGKLYKYREEDFNPYRGFVVEETEIKIIKRTSKMVTFVFNDTRMANHPEYQEGEIKKKIQDFYLDAESFRLGSCTNSLYFKA